jgi:DNA-binding protein HU-beta
MNKAELVDRVAESTGKTKKEASQVVDVVLQTISQALQQGEKVTLIGFGNFEVRERQARTGRNPQTGEEIQIEASKVPSFKPGKQLKELVNQS